MKKMKKITIAAGVATSLALSVAFTVKAELIGHYSWGYFYSEMSNKYTRASVSATSSKYVRPIARNSHTSRRGRWVKAYDGSVAEVAHTAHSNRTGYELK